MGHITNTNIDQISSSESRPSIIFKISTKHQPLHKTWGSKSWPNQASESWPRLNFITTWSISSKTMTKPRFILDSTFYKTSAEKNWPNSSFKSCLNFNFKILTKLFAQSLNKHLDFWPNLSFKISTELQLQNLDQTFCSKSEQKFTFITKLQLPNLQLPSSTRFSLLTRVANNRTWVRKKDACNS